MTSARQSCRPGAEGTDDGPAFGVYVMVMSLWVPVTDRDAEVLERELARELRAVARRFDRDDVAFELDDGSLCVVHLTWKVERDPRWPQCDFVSELPEDEAEE